MNVLTKEENTIIPKTISQAVLALEDKMMETLLRFEQHYRKELPIPIIKVERLGKGRLGQASHHQNSIWINSDLITPLRWEHIRNVTLPHEVCHIVAPLIHNNYKHGNYRGHGNSWRECMKVVNLPPNRCSTVLTQEEREMTSKRVLKKTFVYGCPCGKTFKLTSILHNRILKGNTRRCVACNGTIFFEGDEA